MNSIRKKLGVIIAVEGSTSQVGMYNLSNDAEYIWYGDVITGPKVGAFLTINQNDIKIIATVSTEKVVDQQNTVKSTEFDNRYKKNSINRMILLKTKGVIEEGKFQVTSKHVPMIGNEVTLTTLDELKIIYDIGRGEGTISIGKSLIEGLPIQLSINKFFASHIGIFGNTGSGKSNTLHKLYLELFRSDYYNSIVTKSQFFVIDFNGEYLGENQFGVNPEHKKLFDIDTRSESNGNKLPIKSSYLFDPDILSILFDARAATQVPFLRQALRQWNSQKFDGNSFSKFVVGTLKKILTTGNSASSDAKDNWINIASDFTNNTVLFNDVKNLIYNSTTKGYFYQSPNKYINDKSGFPKDAVSILKLNQITTLIANVFDQCDGLEKLHIHLKFQKVHHSAWKSLNIEFINPLFKRIETSLESLSRVVELKEDITNEYSGLNIISLAHANKEVSRLLPMLLSKMIYDEQKNLVAGTEVKNTKHLIIDEAHNILNAQFSRVGDSWQDYRLSVFEEIIKEGRKFGFYLTLSSQRPADISPTILSQTHNYFIHRLVNETDLRMLENTMPTLDNNSYQMIPSLGKGEAIVTGNAIQVPIFVKIDKEEINRPNSDDVILTDIWDINERNDIEMI